MNREDYAQFDRIEEKLDILNSKTDELMNQAAKEDDIIVGFYKQEIESESGRLHHLANDRKFLDLIMELDKESEQNESENELEMEFDGKPLR